MLGRHVTAALRRPLQARLRAIAAPPTQSSLCIRNLSYAPRLLTPVGRPRKAVGEPSRPVKRAVKAKAKKPASTETDAAAKKIAEKEKAAKKKAAATKKAKPALTPEQVEKKKLALQKAEVKELKRAALQPPAKSDLTSAYIAFTKEKGKELKELIANESGSNGKVKAVHALGQHQQNVAAAWKNVTPSELEVSVWLKCKSANVLLSVANTNSTTTTSSTHPKKLLMRSTNAGSSPTTPTKSESQI